MGPPISPTVPKKIMTQSNSPDANTLESELHVKFHEIPTSHFHDELSTPIPQKTYPAVAEKTEPVAAPKAPDQTAGQTLPNLEITSSADLPGKNQPARGVDVKENPAPGTTTAPLPDKNLLAQEALLADPALMRKMFPTLLKDLGGRWSGYLNMADISEGLDKDNITQDDRNLLTVLKAGYTEFSQLPSAHHTLKHEDAGVSANTLAVVDKSVNRSIADDPIRRYDQTWGLISPVLTGASAAGYISKFFKASPRTRLIATGVTGVAFGILYEVAQTGDGPRAKTDAYNGEKNNYEAFVKDFVKTNGGKDKPVKAVQKF